MLSNMVVGVSKTVQRNPDASQCGATAVVRVRFTVRHGAVQSGQP